MAIKTIQSWAWTIWLQYRRCFCGFWWALREMPKLQQTHPCIFKTHCTQHVMFNDNWWCSRHALATSFHPHHGNSAHSAGFLLKSQWLWERFIQLKLRPCKSRASGYLILGTSMNQLYVFVKIVSCQSTFKSCQFGHVAKSLRSNGPFISKFMSSAMGPLSWLLWVPQALQWPKARGSWDGWSSEVSLQSLAAGRGHFWRYGTLTP